MRNAPQVPSPLATYSKNAIMDQHTESDVNIDFSSEDGDENLIIDDDEAENDLRDVSLTSFRHSLAHSIGRYNDEYWLELNNDRATHRREKNVSSARWQEVRSGERLLHSSIRHDEMLVDAG